MLIELTLTEGQKLFIDPLSISSIAEAQTKKKERFSTIYLVGGKLPWSQGKFKVNESIAEILHKYRDHFCKFILLTCPLDKNPIFVNSSTITAIYAREDDFSDDCDDDEESSVKEKIYITFLSHTTGSGADIVQESPEYVLEKVNQIKDH